MRSPTMNFQRLARSRAFVNFSFASASLLPVKLGARNTIDLSYARKNSSLTSNSNNACANYHQHHTPEVFTSISCAGTCSAAINDPSVNKAFTRSSNASSYIIVTLVTTSKNSVAHLSVPYDASGETSNSSNHLTAVCPKCNPSSSTEALNFSNDPFDTLSGSVLVVPVTPAARSKSNVSAT